MDKEQALHKFWSGFGLTAYDENTVPDNALTTNGGKYLTYNVATASLDEPTPLYANLWYKSSSWAEITVKANEISVAIGRGGAIVSFDGGKIWICRGTPFSQRMPDDDDTIRRIYINVMAEYLSAD
jgi:hypothetical protein